MMRRMSRFTKFSTVEIFLIKQVDCMTRQCLSLVWLYRPCLYPALLSCSRRRTILQLAIAEKAILKSAQNRPLIFFATSSTFIRVEVNIKKKLFFFSVYSAYKYRPNEKPFCLLRIFLQFYNYIQSLMMQHSGFQTWAQNDSGHSISFSTKP